MVVYLITNLINGKVYVGKDANNDPNYLGSGLLIKKAINKYGRDSFTKEILFESDDLDEINKMECEYIKKFKDMLGPNCYNLAEGGTGGNTIKHHPNRNEIIAKRNKAVSKGLIGHNVSEEAKAKQSKSHTGWFDRMNKEDQEAYRKLQSKTMKEYYANNGHHSKGRKLTDSHKEKLSDAAIQNGFGGDTWSNLTDDEKKIKSEKLSNAKKGKTLSKDTKAKISNSLKGTKRSEETKKKISESLKKRKLNE